MVVKYAIHVGGLRGSPHSLRRTNSAKFMRNQAGVLSHLADIKWGFVCRRHYRPVKRYAIGGVAHREVRLNRQRKSEPPCAFRTMPALAGCVNTSPIKCHIFDKSLSALRLLVTVSLEGHGDTGVHGVMAD